MRTARRGEAWLALAMLLPILLAVAILRIWPVVDAALVSIAPQEPGKIVDLSGYTSLFEDPNFQSSVLVTFLFSLIVNPLQLFLALCLALLLNGRVWGTGLWRTLVLLPIVIPQSVSAIIWGVAFRPDGPINAIFKAVGLASQPFLTSPTQAMGCIIVIVSWVGVGYWMTFLIAGLKDIPPSLYEAATIDGAGWFRRLWSITLPMLRRPLLFVIIADTVSNFLVFAPPQILTNGGPDGSTDFVIYEIFQRAFVNGDAQGAAAITVILVAVVLVIVSLQFGLLEAADRS